MLFIHIGHTFLQGFISSNNSSPTKKGVKFLREGKRWANTALPSMGVSFNNGALQGSWDSSTLYHLILTFLSSTDHRKALKGLRVWAMILWHKRFNLNLISFTTYYWLGVNTVLTHLGLSLNKDVAGSLRFFGTFTFLSITFTTFFQVHYWHLVNRVTQPCPLRLGLSFNTDYRGALQGLRLSNNSLALLLLFFTLSLSLSIIEN